MIRIQRSYPPPASLNKEAQKAHGNYGLPDVTEQLRADFYDKCYICEIKPVADPEIEHRLPHKNHTIPGREFNWDNLYWACRHCNSIKAQAKYDAGILDCCNCDPEEYLRHKLIDYTVIVQAVDIHNDEAVLTAQLITEAFTLTNTGIRIAASQIRLNAPTG